MSVNANPLLNEWTAPFGAPPFSSIAPGDFEDAFARAFEAYRTAIDTIAGNEAAATFENTVEELEKADAGLTRLARVFFNLAGTDTNEALQKIEREVTPKFAKHAQATYMNEALFARIEHLVKSAGDLDLTAEQERLLERYHTNFIRAGARLSGHDRTRMSEITERLARLGTEFSQNILKAENQFRLILESNEDLKGLPDFLVRSAARTAEELGEPGKHVITLARSSIDPFLQYSARRDLREEAFTAYTSRGGSDGETDNRAIAEETVRLRHEQANLLGFNNYAEFRLDDAMAKTPGNVRDLLAKVWQPARMKAEEEGRRLSELARAEGANIQLEAWDWRYYSEKLRKAEFDIDEADAKPYLQLDKMIEAAFDTAGKLFGLTFEEQMNVPKYHDDVRIFEVKERNGDHLALFMGDYFARPSKRSGAWMSAFRGQEKLGGDIRPIIVNVMNFIAGAEGEATLLTLDDARTLFHEFGHALHGMLSNVTYPSLAGTSVSRDFVELPSQLFEHWLTRPEILKRFAVHHKTGKPMPDEMLDKLLKARQFNQGFASVEYVASAMVDLDLHTASDPENINLMDFEAAVLARIEMPDAIKARHSAPHFAHIFSGDGYSSAYYSYLWSEVMDADAFHAFEEKGDPFDPDTATRLRDTILSVGNAVPPEEAYRAFRGRMPEIDAMLEKKGLATN